MFYFDSAKAHCTERNFSNAQQSLLSKNHFWSFYLSVCVTLRLKFSWKLQQVLLYESHTHRCISTNTLLSLPTSSLPNLSIVRNYCSSSTSLPPSSLTQGPHLRDRCLSLWVSALSLILSRKMRAVLILLSSTLHGPPTWAALPQLDTMKLSLCLSNTHCTHTPCTLHRAVCWTETELHLWIECSNYAETPAAGQYF